MFNENHFATPPVVFLIALLWSCHHSTFVYSATFLDNGAKSTELKHIISSYAVEYSPVLMLSFLLKHIFKAHFWHSCQFSTLESHGVNSFWFQWAFKTCPVRRSLHRWRQLHQQHSEVAACDKQHASRSGALSSSRTIWWSDSYGHCTPVAFSSLPRKVVAEYSAWCSFSEPTALHRIIGTQYTVHH